MSHVWIAIAQPAMRLTLRTMLESEGFAVSSGGALPETAHAVITDDFAEAVKYARERPTLILAGAPQLREAVGAMRQGVFGYVFVPFQPGEAVLMIQRALEWARHAPPVAAPEQPLAVKDAETQAILAALRQCRNNQTQAARLLGIGRNTLWRKLKQIRTQDHA